MPVDTSIYFQQRPFTLDNPLDTTAKRLGIETAMDQRAAEKDTREALAASGGDMGKAADLLMSKGRHKEANAFRTQLQAQRKAQFDEQLKLSEAVGSDAITLDTLYRQALQASGGDRNKAIEHVSPIYSQVRGKWARLGHQIDEQFDPDKNFAAIGSAKENIQYLKTLQPDIRMTDTGGAITPTNVNPNAGAVGPLPNAQPIAKTAAPAAPTELARLQAERDALPAGDPRRAEYDRVLASYKAGRATDVTIQQPGPLMPGRTAANQVDEGLLDTTRNLMQLDQIAGQFKPEYQTFLTKGANWWSSIKEKAGVNLDQAERRGLQEFSAYKRNAIDSLNQYIKSITGAAMTNEEAKRILKGLPDAGSGLFDGDSPTEFKAKLDDAIRTTKTSIARLAYIKRRGMSLTDEKGNAVVPLERMPTIMKERARQIETELRRTSPNATDDGMRRAIQMQIGREFGLAVE